MKPEYDAIILGSDHNALTTASYLAKAGKNIVILEPGSNLGGVESPQDIFDGISINIGLNDAGLFQQKIYQDLNLSNFGVKFTNTPIAVYGLNPEGNPLTLWRNDINKSQEEIRKFSEHDANIYPEFINTIERYTKALRKILIQIPPDPFEITGKDIKNWVPSLISLRRLGGRDMMGLIRSLPMTIKEFLDEWFENEFLKGILGSTSVTGNFLGPQSAGSALIYLYHQLGEINGGYRSSQFVEGGIENLTKGFERYLANKNVKIIKIFEIKNIIIKDGIAIGVKDKQGKEIFSKYIISSYDPSTTLFDLCGPALIEPETMRKIRNIKYRGSMAKIILKINNLPNAISSLPQEYFSSHMVICPSLDYLEHAFDEAKYGEISKKPYLDITFQSTLTNKLILIDYKFAPYKLSQGGWDVRKNEIFENSIGVLKNLFPDITNIVEDHYVVTPLDYERNFNLHEGHLYQGQMGLDQLLVSRPISGYAQYKTPIKNLYLCGPGTHPGGGISGASGFNAAKSILSNT